MSFPAPPAVYIGRFQPLHDAHLRTMLDALTHFPRLIVLPGSANLARSVKNPWTAQERVRMIRAALTDAGVDSRRVTFQPVPDEFDSERWAARVRQAVRNGPAVLVGFEKDQSSAYLRWFPDWTAHAAPVTPGLNATDLRAAYFQGRPVEAVPPAVQVFLQAFRATGLYARLQAEWQAVAAQRAAWTGPLPRHELRCLHVQEGQVWLARRAGPVGRGLWELPGRFLAPHEAPPADALVFDHPARALVWPAVAHVVQRPGVGEPVPVPEALRRPRQFFEDHHVIFTRLLMARGE